MNNPTVPVVVATCLLAGFMIGANVAPRVLAEQAGRHAAREALTPTVQNVAHHAVEEESHKIAEKISRKTRSQATRRAHLEPAPDPTPVPDPIEVRRDAFAITLPPGCNVTPNGTGIDSDHKMSIDVPGHGTIYIIVVDSKERAGTGFDDIVSTLRSKLDQPEEAEADLFDSLQTTRTTSIKARVLGLPTVYQIAQVEGWEKGVILMTEFPEEDRDQAGGIIRRAIETFRMRE